MPYRAFVWIVAAVCMLINCASPGAPPPSPAPPTPVVSQALDLGQVMRQVHFAFRPGDDSDWTGGHSTYRVRVRDGAVRVTPSSCTGDAEHCRESTALSLLTEHVRRGTLELQLRSAAARIDNHGSIVLPGAQLRETWTNHETGVDQAWVFDRAPDGAGDLWVEVSANGEAYLGTTDAGLHFQAQGDSVGLRYSHAHWVDASGRRTPIPTIWNGRAIELRVPEQVLRDTVWPAALDPTISPEVGMDHPILAPLPNGRGAPAVAYGAGVFLVVWTDYRTDPVRPWIFGTRVSPSGSLLDSFGFPIRATPGVDAIAPGVASDGTDFIVVWEEAPPGVFVHDIMGAKVTSAGVVGAPFPISSGPEGEAYASIG